MLNSKTPDEILHDRRSVNGELIPTQSSFNTAMIGTPRGDFAQYAQDATDHDFISMIWKGHFCQQPTWGLKPFCTVLEKIDATLKKDNSNIYQRLRHCGVLSCRLTRVSKSVISNHSWGIAIDLTLDSRRDIALDGADLKDLSAIASAFIDHGLYWGIAFPRPEATHFEASQQLIESWAHDGLIRGAPQKMNQCMQFGDRSVAVERMQRAINTLLETCQIEEDGIFGIDTRNAVIEAHIRLGLPPEAQASPAFMRNIVGDE